MRFSVKILVGVVAVGLIAGTSHAGFLDGLFKKHEDCKKPYIEEVEKCRSDKQVNAYKQWVNHKEWKKVDEVMDECIDKAYEKLLKCRMDKGKFKKGKKKSELESALNKVKEKEKKDNDKCLKDWMDKGTKGELGDPMQSYEKFYVPCLDKVAKDAVKDMIDVLEEYVEVSKKGGKRDQIEKTRE